MIAIVGWIGSALCVASLLQKDQLRFRALNLGSCAAMITFNVANATWSMVLLNVVVAVINVRSIIAGRTTAADVVSADGATCGDAACADAGLETEPLDVQRSERELVAA